MHGVNMRIPHIQIYGNFTVIAATRQKRPSRIRVRWEYWWWYLSLYLSLYHSIDRSIILSITVSLYHPIYLYDIYHSITLSTYLSIILSITLSMYHPIYLMISITLSLYLFIYRSIILSVHHSIYLSIDRSLYLSLYLSIYLSLYISICRSIYLSTTTTTTTTTAAVAVARRSIEHRKTLFYQYQPLFEIGFYRCVMRIVFFPSYSDPSESWISFALCYIYIYISRWPICYIFRDWLYGRCLGPCRCCLLCAVE